MMTPLLITGPTVEPISLSDMRTYLRLDTTSEDDLVSALITAGRLMIEAASRRLLIEQSWRLVLDQWPESGEIKLPLSPIIAVSQIRTYDANSAASILETSLYSLEITSEPAILRISSGAANPKKPRQGIEIDLRVGYGATDDAVPATLRQALRLLVNRWFENRGDALQNTGLSTSGLPSDVMALIAPHRPLRMI